MAVVSSNAEGSFFIWTCLESNGRADWQSLAEGELEGRTVAYFKYWTSLRRSKSFSIHLNQHYGNGGKARHHSLLSWLAGLLVTLLHHHWWAGKQCLTTLKSSSSICGDIYGSVVALEIGLGLETGLRAPFWRSWSRLGIKRILTQPCLGLGHRGLKFFDHDQSRPQKIYLLP